MVEIHKDRKSSTWLITVTDREGFHRCLNVTREELLEIHRFVENGIDG